MQMKNHLHSLTIFRHLLQNAVIQKLMHLLDASSDSPEWMDLYCDFVASLYLHTDNLTEYITTCVLEDENAYVHQACRQEEISSHIVTSLQRELRILQQVAQLTPADLQANDATLYPGWTVESCDLPTLYFNHMALLSSRGYGIFAKYHMFTLVDGHLMPVKHPDPQKLNDLSGYEIEREKILRNTEALLKGQPFNNVLLYGDAGTGKSSTVKAIANDYKDQGLRLVEVKKNQLFQIPALLDELAHNPLKFILFIDDLSFNSNDDDFAALKAILEGSAHTTGQNLAIYATSNRRHLVKETHHERQGDEIHLADTLQEIMSLSARFGLTVTFSRPKKELYLHIVETLAKARGLEMCPSELFIQAEAFALRCGGRSPRAAKQFVDSLSEPAQED